MSWGLERTSKETSTRLRWVIKMLNYGFYNMNCMDGMREFPDKFFDIAVVDRRILQDQTSADIMVGLRVQH